MPTRHSNPQAGQDGACQTDVAFSVTTCRCHFAPLCLLKPTGHAASSHLIKDSHLLFSATAQRPPWSTDGGLPRSQLSEGGCRNRRCRRLGPESSARPSAPEGAASSSRLASLGRCVINQNTTLDPCYPLFKPFGEFLIFFELRCHVRSCSSFEKVTRALGNCQNSRFCPHDSVHRSPDSNGRVIVNHGVSWVRSCAQRSSWRDRGCPRPTETLDASAWAASSSRNRRSTSSDGRATFPLSYHDTITRLESWRYWAMRFWDQPIARRRAPEVATEQGGLGIAPKVLPSHHRTLRQYYPAVAALFRRADHASPWPAIVRASVSASIAGSRVGADC